MLFLRFVLGVLVFFWRRSLAEVEIPPGAVDLLLPTQEQLDEAQLDGRSVKVGRHGHAMIGRRRYAVLLARRSRAVQSVLLWLSTLVSPPPEQPRRRIGLSGRFYTLKSLGRVLWRIVTQLTIVALASAVLMAVVNPFGPKEVNWDRVTEALRSTDNATVQEAGVPLINEHGDVFVGDGATVRALLKRLMRISELRINALDFATPQAAVNAASAGNAVWFDPRATWNWTVALTVNKPLTLCGDYTLITQTAAGTSGIVVSSSAVIIEKLHLVGVSGTTINGNEKAIDLEGADVNHRLIGVIVRHCKIEQWGYAAIYSKFLDTYRVYDNDITNLRYAGILLLAANNGVIHKNFVTNIVQGDDVVNSYGIAVTYDSAVSQAVSPRSQGVTISENHIDGVPKWEAIDTHAGIDIKVINNRVFNAHVAVSMVGGPLPGGAPSMAPKRAQVIGNTLDNTNYTGTLTAIAIQIIGESNGTGFYNIVDWGTGQIQNNTIKGFGDATTLNGGAIVVLATRGVDISGNVALEPAGCMIRLYHTNQDTVVAHNTCTDVWTTSGPQAAMIMSQSTWNTFTVSANTLTRGTLSATTINSIGLYVVSTIATLVIDGGGNNFKAAANPWSAGNGQVRFAHRGIRHAMVSATPTIGVWQQGAQLWSLSPTAVGSPGWVCTTAGGVTTATWAATTAYTAGTWIKTSTSKVLECVVAGTSSGAEPAPTVIDSTVTEGSVTWTYRGDGTAVFTAMPGTFPVIDSQTFTASGTWTKPTVGVPVLVRVRLWSGGGGGGSGAREPSGTLATGGAGGGSGGYTERTFKASDLPATVAVTVAATAAGGAAVTTDATVGNAGGTGATVTFGATGGTYLATTAGGGGGAGGTAAGAAAAGAAGVGGMSAGIAGGASSATGLVGTSTAGAQTNVGSSGGAGGGITTGAVASAGGSSGSIGGVANAAGGAIGANGVAGLTFPGTLGGPGGGGGGGGSSVTGAAGAGGAAGSYGGGGGGGGAALNGNSSGAGGAGGPGLVIVDTFF